jgi:outer membrane lipoprotein-sorting protein
VTEYGDLLKLMHTSIVRWQTLHATGQDWRHRARAERAWERWLAQARSRSIAVMRGGEVDDQPIDRERWSLWQQKPDRIRTEFEVEDEKVTAVIVGDTWWSWSPSRGIRTNAGDPHHSHGPGPGHALIDPSLILPAVELQVVSRGIFIDRPSLNVVATPTHIDKNDEESSHLRSATHDLGSGADEYLLRVDAERGVLLRSEARIDGEPFHILEMESVAFDEHLADDLFAPPKDEPVERVSSPRDVPMSELQDEVSFTVFVPKSPPFGSDYATVHPAEPRGRVPETAHISFASEFFGEEDRQFWLTEAADSLPGREEIEWQHRGGLQFGEDRQVGPGVRIVRLELQGTHIELCSYNLPFNELQELAASLVPLPSAPPQPPGLA